MTGPAFILGPNSARHDMADMREFTERDEYVRTAFDRVAQWSGFSVDVLLHRAERPGSEPLMRLNTLALAAGMLGICDSLAAAGVRPSAVGGISLGERVAGCLAGALTRRQLVDILVFDDGQPADPAHAEAVAFVLVPADQDAGRYHELEDVHVAVDFGMVRRGHGRLLMISGRRSDLLKFAERDVNPIDVPEERFSTTAYHSPLREQAREQLADHLRDMPFTEPAVPVCSCLGDGVTVTSGDGVRDLLVRSTTEPLRVAGMIGEMAARRPSMAVAIGPFMRKGGFAFPFPVTYITEPDDLPRAADDVLSAAA